MELEKTQKATDLGMGGNKEFSLGSMWLRHLCDIQVQISLWQLEIRAVLKKWSGLEIN